MAWSSSWASTRFGIAAITTKAVKRGMTLMSSGAFVGIDIPTNTKLTAGFDSLMHHCGVLNNSNWELELPAKTNVYC
ncbi:hypothetical protein F442_11030 [Phytophthora nicotianae P10297]|uniref:Uncharacterized protein n=3 Tax=Phytophthora nicotianae TaxID=4792 RepID=W2Z412_PHYNI|nr:hypothetical protein L917_10638 [Phytophthora nicotianae]ETO72807.1 hypothetical protein F444_11194 [Phytophthora nicotianae P1976]ETP42028.1 hypothetical protein F442_11030 [Phytophthora nicotianae P10297]